MDLQRQQRLLQRSVKDVLQLANRALQSETRIDVSELERALIELQKFIALHVTAPEIVAYASEIPEIGQGDPNVGLLRTMFMPGWKLLSGRADKAEARVLRRCKEARDKLANLEIFVGMMGED